MSQVELSILVKWKENSKLSWTSKCYSPQIYKPHQNLSRSTTWVASPTVSVPVKAANDILELSASGAPALSRENSCTSSLCIFLSHTHYINDSSVCCGSGNVRGKVYEVSHICRHLAKASRPADQFAKAWDFWLFNLLSKNLVKSWFYKTIWFPTSFRNTDLT